MTESNLPCAGQPLVTAYIPVYNHQQFVAKAIEGMLDQTYRNIELIIINDGSTDDSDAVVKSYLDLCANRFARFEYVNRPNKGLSVTINEALAWASGVYIGGCASDDYWGKEKIETQVRFLEANGAYIGCGSGYAVVDHKNRVLSIKNKARADYTFKGCLVDARQPRALTLLWRKRVFDVIGLYSEDTKIEDWEYMLRVLKNGYRVATLDAILAAYRNHSNNTMKRIDLVDEEEKNILGGYSTEEFYRLASRRALIRQAKRRLKLGYRIRFERNWLLWGLYDRHARELLYMYWRMASGKK